LPNRRSSGHCVSTRAYSRGKFNREVRKSVADELKKISTFGGIGLGVLGYSMTDPLIMLGAFVWWTICQIIANILLAIED